jgi:hypothetical protein
MDRMQPISARRLLQAGLFPEVDALDTGISDPPYLQHDVIV